MDVSSHPEIAAAFAGDGPLAQGIEGYRPRAQQTDMAREIASAIADRKVLVAEAGTGTGKTFAYLVPALLSGGKVIISTGTRTLQDQLFNKDLPMVRDALGIPVQLALLKGRANYVCPYHLKRAMGEGRLASRQDAADLNEINRFAAITRTGDRSDLPHIGEEASAWQYATSTRDNCLGSDCPDYGGCFVMAARRRALESDVVVVNHHLFFADVMLRDEGVAELLPACNTVVLDEAHQLAETAARFFGQTVSTAQVLELVRDARLEALASARDALHLPAAFDALDKSARDFRLTLPTEPSRYALEPLVSRDGFEDGLENLRAALKGVHAALTGQAERSEGLAACMARSEALLQRLEVWQDKDAEQVRWAETYTHSLQLHVTPLSIADLFRRQVEGGGRAWILTSATLSVGGDFGHFVEEMGLVAARTAHWPSPFDYPNQALLYCPVGLPQPNAPGYTEAVVQAALPLIEASEGGVFVLCTSLRAMRQAHALLADGLAALGLDLPLLLQGEGSRSALLKRFRDLGNAVLVGAQSFWEGVDVRGDALRLVVVDRLPFAAPDDPVLAARIARMTREGRNAFMEYQLPRAVIAMKQGAGRLIRDERDRGVLMVCDPRLVEKAYGKRVWRSLPPMARSRELGEAIRFFHPVVEGATCED